MILKYLRRGKLRPGICKDCRKIRLISWINVCRECYWEGFYNGKYGND